MRSATTNDGHDVIVCEELFAEAPFIRPPPDEAPFAFGATDGSMLYLRDAEPRPLTTEESALMGLGVENDSEAKRFGYALYRFELGDAGTVVASTPVILVEDAAFLSFLSDVTLEGLISRRDDDPNTPNDFEDPPTLAIRLRFAAASTPSDNSDPSLDAISTSELALVVENLTDGVLASDGSCLAPITDAGAESPFDGAAPELKGLRVPSMHGPGDNEFVIDGAQLVNHMTPGWIVLPHHLLTSTSFTFEDADFMPHGNPFSMPRLSLSVVTSGGGACP